MDEKKANIMPPDVWVMHNQVGEALAKAARLEGFIRGIKHQLNAPAAAQVDELLGRSMR